MSRIELSQDFAADYIKRIIGKNQYSVDFVSWNPGRDPQTPALRLKTLASVTGLLAQTCSATGGGYSYGPGALAIQCALMNGAMPTSISSIVSYAAISSGVLVKFCSIIDRNSVTMRDFVNATIDTTNPVIINTDYVMSEMAGTATWFLLFGKQQLESSFTDSIVPLIMGTVGQTGSGADLQIPDTAIVATQAYRIVDLRLQFPTSWVV